MHLLRAGSICVANLSASVAVYERWLDYSPVEQGTLEGPLVKSWETPGMEGARFAVLRPASGKDIFVRLIEASPVKQFVPLTTYGWAALEFCVTDVLATHEQMRESPFEVIGPPRKITGLDAIHPMQVRGPDGEICYFTQINDDLPDFALPRASSPIDHLFINVLAASDMAATQRWLVDQVGLEIGRAHMEIEYTMLAKAFGAPSGTLYAISTITHGRDVFLEVDQMPAQAGPRPRHEGMLPPGICMTTIEAPDFDALEGAAHAFRGAIYDGRRCKVLKDPDGTLFELVERG